MVFLFFNSADREDISEDDMDNMDSNTERNKKEVIDYGEGIIIRRLIDNKIESLWQYEDKKKNEESDDEDIENSIFKNSLGSQY